MARISRNSKPKRERSSLGDGGNKPLVIAVVGIIAIILAFFILMGILFFHFIGRFVDDDSSNSQMTTMTYSIKQRSDFQNGYSGRIPSESGENSYGLYGEEDEEEAEETSKLPKVTSNYGTGSEFVYGTVKGSRYQSKFSGITFDAPKGWTLKGASKSSVTPTTVLDLDARSSSGAMTVKLQYFTLSGGNYTSSAQVLKALRGQLDSSVEVESKKKEIAGNNFVGFAFDGMNGQDVARSEILVTQVNGYALVLQVVAPNQKDIDNILKNFS